jgi:hypothetical protein
MDCPICLDTIDDTIIIMSCGCTFHKVCINRWIRIYNYVEVHCPKCNDIFTFTVCDIIKELNTVNT